MKHSIFFLFFVSLVGAPAYNCASSWNNDDIAKMGIVLTGAAAVLYFFTHSSDAHDTPHDLGVNDFNHCTSQGSGIKSEQVEQVKQLTQSKNLCNTENNRGLVETDTQITDVLEKKKQDSNWLEKVAKSDALRNMTWHHVGGVVGLVCASYLLGSMAIHWKNRKADHVVLYENIVNDCYYASNTCKVVCKRVQTHKDNGVIKEAEASAIITYITGLRNRLYKGHAAAESIIGFVGNNQQTLSLNDFDKLVYLDNQSNIFVKKIEQIEQCSRGELGVQLLVRELSESKESSSEKSVTTNNHCESSAKEEPKTFEEAIAEAREKCANIEQEQFDQQLSQRKAFLDSLLIAISVSIIVPYCWFWFWNEKKKRDKQRLEPMLLCH